MNRLGGGLSRNLGALFEWLSYRAGVFFFLSVTGAFAYGGLYYLVFRQDSEDAVRGAPIPLNLLVFAGLAMIVYSFIAGARNRPGKWPTMTVVAFAYLFGLTIITVLVSRVDRLPYLLDIPDWILYANRTSLYWMIFSVGWVLGYGTPRGWNRRTVDPWPFRWLFKHAPAVSDGTEDDEQ